MRLGIGRFLALVTLVLAGASACGEAAPDASPTASAGAGDSRTACDAVMKARKKALDALTPVSKVLKANGASAVDIAKASDDLKAVFAAMHVDVATAAERAGEPALQAKITAYQVSVEQAIVVVESADGDPAKLVAAMELPEMRDAEKSIMAACA